MKVKRVLYIVLLVVLFIPLAETILGFKVAKSLSGVVETTDKPKFSLNDYFEGKYQSKQEKYLGDITGGREIFIRVRNQIYFSLYGINPNGSVIIGNDGYLFDWGYLAAVNGDDFLGQDSIDKKCSMIKKLQDTLATMNKELIIVLAPGKGSYYKEFIPQKYFHKDMKGTNYTSYVEGFKQSDVDYLDFRKWFIALKDAVSYPLFPRTGVHWSHYAWMIASDSLVHYFSRHSDCNNYVTCKNIRLSSRAEDSDYDSEQTLNLIFYMKHNTMAYPEDVKCVIDSSFIKQNAIIVGDSYTWGIFLADLRAVFNNSQFYYYNREAYYAKKDMVKDLDLKAEVADTDVIMIIYTDGNLGVLGNGFVESLYKLYFPN